MRLALTGAFICVLSGFGGIPCGAGGGFYTICPSDTVIRPGRSLVLRHGFANETDDTLYVCYVISGQRWPPNTVVSDPNPIFPGDVQLLPLLIQAPDSAASGANVITWSVPCLRVSRPECSYRINIPELISGVRFVSSASRVGLTWSVADSSADTATVYRRGADSLWTMRGEIIADLDATLGFVDRTVEPGARYEYQLGLPVANRQIYRGQITVAVLDLLSEASADPYVGRIVLTWVPNDSAAYTAAVYRQDGAGSWENQGMISGSATVALAYEDRSVVPGVTYRYRLGIVVNGQEHFRGEIEALAPIAVGELRLEFASANPARGPVLLAVTKGNDAPSRLDVLDIGGRIIRTIAVPRQPGRFEIDIVGDRRLAPGIYFVNLLHGRHRRTLRLTVLE